MVCQGQADPKRDEYWCHAYVRRQKLGTRRGIQGLHITTITDYAFEEFHKNSSCICPGCVDKASWRLRKVMSASWLCGCLLVVAMYPLARLAGWSGKNLEAAGAIAIVAGIFALLTPVLLLSNTRALRSFVGAGLVLRHYRDSFRQLGLAHMGRGDNPCRPRGT